MTNKLVLKISLRRDKIRERTNGVGETGSMFHWVNSQEGHRPSFLCESIESRLLFRLKWIRLDVTLTYNVV